MNNIPAIGRSPFMTLFTNYDICRSFNSWCFSLALTL